MIAMNIDLLYYTFPYFMLNKISEFEFESLSDIHHAFCRMIVEPFRNQLQTLAASNLL